MKLTLFIMFLSLASLKAEGIYSQSTRVNLSLQDVSVKDVLKKIEEKSDFFFLFNSKMVDVNRIVTVNAKNQRIDEILKQLFDHTDVAYAVVDKQIVLTKQDFQSGFIKLIGYQNQQNIVKGKVTAVTDGQSLPGVNILIKGSSNGTITDLDGNYSIQAESDAILLFSMMGYITKEIPVNGQSEINVAMEEDTKGLEEVVVVGYGTLKKGNITSAIATFSAENLEERPVYRVDQAMVGQMAGVQVKQTTGSLGKGFSIAVRGTGSLSAGNEPLYVIDGFPLATAAPNGAGNFANGNPLDNINPSDIESIQVLKDASAAAIYGSRAANGVVIITTKKGKAGKPKISFDSYIGYSQAIRKLDMLSADEWVDRSIEMIDAQWVASGPGRTADQTTDQRRTILGLGAGLYNTTYMIDDRWNEAGHPGLNYLDWQDEILRKGMVQNYQLSATGGSEAVNYYISGNYINQEGIVKGMDYTSFSARANVEVTAVKNLKFGINLTPTYSVNNDPGVEGKDAIWHQAISMSPVQEDTMGVYANTGNFGQYKWSNSRNSPVAQLEQSIGQVKRFRTIASVFAEYQIIKGLKFRSSANLDYLDAATKAYVPYTVTGTVASRQASNNTLTSGNYRGYKRMTFVNENTLAYDLTLADKHNITLLAGFSYNTDFLTNYQINSNGGFNNAGVTTLNEAAGWTGTTTESKNVLLSYFGRAQYNFSDKYLLSASIRRDGSSRFGENSKWAVFPSASIGWRVSNEDFMKNIPVISDLKLRASWGTAGNYNIGDYSSIATLSTYGYAFGTAKVVGRAVNASVNPDLTWETSNTIDGGMEIGVLKNRISASFDYYDKLNTGLLLNVPVPAVTGFTTSLSNVGKVRNKGWELELTTRNFIGDFSWTTSANLTHNQNKVEELGPGQDQILVPSAFDINHSILKIGEQVNSIYVVRQTGILSQADIDAGAALFGTQTVGDPKYDDANGDGKIDANDRVIVGHPNPDYVWGITNTFKYKGFDLTVLVQGQNGGSIYSLFGRAVGRTGQGYVDNYLGLGRDRWRSVDDPGAGQQGKAYSTFGRIKNTDWLYASDYWRIRNITIGYDLGKLIKSKFIEGGRIYVSAENWFGKDKYYGGCNPEATNTDVSGSSQFPEAGDYGGLPLAKSLIFGLNLTF